MSPLDDLTLTRRCAIRRALLGGASYALIGALPLLESCGGPDPPPGLRVPLSQVPPNGRLVVMDGELPIEIVRQGEGVIARSLLCTHQGCQVAWEPGPRRYHCPCHQGVFDAEGRPVSGPPELPLREYPVHRVDELIIVETQVLAEGT